ncbi:MAG: S-layer homology domain-containing protein [Clostridia bacterium]|nr:S-layer homology domain-containing protein [Clostridia bacterium]
MYNITISIFYLNKYIHRRNFTMRKRGISLLVALVMILSVSISAMALTFTDVEENFWAKTEIETLSNVGVISGYPDGTFKPNADITKEESVALFAKALGYNEETNEEIVSFANEKYASLLENYTSYAVNQSAYLLYKGVLAESDMVNYMATANKSQPLKRYEAATMIAKALGADAWLSTNPDFELLYADAADIPEAAKAYVYYAGEKGIMKGMDETTFSPNSSVTRAQVATMIFRILDAMNFTYTKGVVAKVDDVLNTLTMKTTDGDTLSYNISKEIPVRINGELSKVTLLEEGLEVVMTKTETGIFAIDAIKVIPDETIIGSYKGKMTETNSTTVKIADLETGVVTSYKLAVAAAITYKGEAGSLSSYVINDYVKAEIKNGEIAVIDAEPKTAVVEKLIVDAIEFTPDVTLKLRTKNDEIVSYEVKSGASLKRNNKVAKFDDLAIGDTVDLTLEYGIVASVFAIGTDKRVTGTVEEITISKNTSYIIVNANNKTTKYALSRDAQIKLDGKEASIYDIRLGAEVSFEASSNTIKSLTVQSVAISTQVTGTIKLVNTSYGMIVVDAVDASGNVVEKQIFVKDTVKILDANDGKVKSVKDLAAGKSIMAAISEKTGILEATSIMILAQ